MTKKIIDSDNKSKLRPSEYFAKLVLEKLFPDRFFELEVLDKPDLQNSSEGIGIEVTTAVPASQKEMSSRFSMIVQNQGTTDQLEKSKERIRQLGGYYSDKGYMVSWTGYRDLNRIYIALEDKLVKLNSGNYRLFENQYIFITDESLIKPEELNEIHAEINKRQSTYAIYFDSVFLYLYGGTLIEFDMITGEDHCYDVCDNEVLAGKAYQMAHDS